MQAVDLPRLILALRPDLCRRFGFDRPDKADDYLAWLLTSGLREYRALQEDPTFLQRLASTGPSASPHGLTVLQAAIYRARPDVQQAFALPQQRQQFLRWFWFHAVGEHGLWPLLTQAERQVALRVAEVAQSPWLSTLLEQGSQADGVGQQSSTVLGTRTLPFGVNLVGYAFGQLGIGEDLRMTARALQAAGVPFAIVNFKPGNDIPQNDRSLARHVLPDGELGPYAINLFCMTAEETGRFYAERGRAQFEGRHNIGYWPWELSAWPGPWRLAHPLVDEVWVSTQHIHDALRPAFDGPIQVMPLVVEPERGSHAMRTADARRATRRKHRLPLQARLFCFAFDLNSSMHRKNPQACVQAFLRAFPKGGFSRRQVGLVIKTHAPRGKQAAWQKLKALAAQDDRIHIIEGTLPRAELMALYAACDSFVSLHRAEGFGRGIAEALQLGMHVIATGYSGNVDYCTRPEFAAQVSLVPYRLVKLRPGQYPNAQGQVWSNPSVAAAAKAMRQFVEEPPTPPKVPRGGWPCFSAKVLGQAYAQRLRQISAGPPR